MSELFKDIPEFVEVHIIWLGQEDRTALINRRLLGNQ